MAIFKKITIIFTVLIMLTNLNSKGTYALDDYAQELTETTVFDSSNTKNLGRLTDDYIRKAWETPIVTGMFVSGYNEIEISGISLWFKEIPRYFILQVSVDGVSWTDEKTYEDETLYNSYFQLESPSNY